MKTSLNSEEKKIAIYTLENQLIEKQKHNEMLEYEIVGLRKELEKVKNLNIIFSKVFETIYEIIKVQHSPLLKKFLRYIGESSQIENSSTTSYLNAAKCSKKSNITQQKNKAN